MNVEINHARSIVSFFSLSGSLESLSSPALSLLPPNLAGCRRSSGSHLRGRPTPALPIATYYRGSCRRRRRRRRGPASSGAARLRLGLVVGCPAVHSSTASSSLHPRVNPHGVPRAASIAIPLPTSSSAPLRRHLHAQNLKARVHALLPVAPPRTPPFSRTSSTPMPKFDRRALHHRRLRGRDRWKAGMPCIRPRAPHSKARRRGASTTWRSSPPIPSAVAAVQQDLVHIKVQFSPLLAQLKTPENS
jgi:hypothetical protein